MAKRMKRVKKERVKATPEQVAERMQEKLDAKQERLDAEKAEIQILADHGRKGLSLWRRREFLFEQVNKLEKRMTDLGMSVIRD